ncbi:MAG: hypothetical protein OXE76_09980 [Alphaproteobacteria bacterium]|nr:hypothetical protein [Alphaproteobacteria bacterium]
MNGTTEAFGRIKIDALLKDAGWNLTDGSSVLHVLRPGRRFDRAKLITVATLQTMISGRARSPKSTHYRPRTGLG